MEIFLLFSFLFRKIIPFFSSTLQDGFSVMETPRRLPFGLSCEPFSPPPGTEIVSPNTSRPDAGLFLFSSFSCQAAVSVPSPPYLYRVSFVSLLSLFIIITLLLFLSYSDKPPLTPDQRHWTCISFPGGLIHRQIKWAQPPPLDPFPCVVFQIGSSKRMGPRPDQQSWRFPL